MQTLYTTFELQPIFDAAKQGKKRLGIHGRDISIRRMECFAYKGTACVRCNIVGNVLMLDKWHNGSLHLDLYHLPVQWVCRKGHITVNPLKPDVCRQCKEMETALWLSYFEEAKGERTLITIDHILPRSRGGKDHLTNYQPMCHICNTAKGATLEDEKVNVELCGGSGVNPLY